jgi:hypothetical protein
VQAFGIPWPRPNRNGGYESFELPLTARRKESIASDRRNDCAKNIKQQGMHSKQIAGKGEKQVTGHD